MNFIWSGMILISIITAIATGRVDETVNAVFEGASTAVSTLISFAGAMCFWTGIMKVAEKSGVSDFICRLISPLVNFLFRGCGKEAKRFISMNMTANFLGMGNAATPMGMLAASELDKENKTPFVPSYALSMLVVLNTTSFQLVPTTIISLRAAAGATDAVSVIVPVWIVSAFAVATAVLSVKLMFWHKGEKEVRKNPSGNRNP